MKHEFQLDKYSAIKLFKIGQLECHCILGEPGEEKVCEKQAIFFWLDNGTARGYCESCKKEIIDQIFPSLIGKNRGFMIKHGQEVLVYLDDTTRPN